MWCAFSHVHLRRRRVQLDGSRMGEVRRSCPSCVADSDSESALGVGGNTVQTFLASAGTLALACFSPSLLERRTWSPPGSSMSKGISGASETTPARASEVRKEETHASAALKRRSGGMM